MSPDRYRPKPSRIDRLVRKFETQPTDMLTAKPREIGQALLELQQGSDPAGVRRIRDAYVQMVLRTRTDRTETQAIYLATVNLDSVAVATDMLGPRVTTSGDLDPRDVFLMQDDIDEGKVEPGPVTKFYREAVDYKRIAADDPF